MEGFSVTIDNKIIGKGLTSNNNIRNNPMLVESIGAMPYNNVIQSVEEFTRVDTSGLAAQIFPYPQLFVLGDIIVVCTAQQIYEYDATGDTFTSKISGLSLGNTWDLVDFKSFILLMNGVVAVTKDPETGDYAVDSTLPPGNCICNFNGQVLLGGPDEND